MHATTDVTAISSAEGSDGVAVSQPPETVERDVAFAGIYHDCYVRLVRLARLVGDSGRGEEIVQDAFVQLYRNWSRVDAPVPWLRSAVINGCRSAGRRRQVARRHPMVAGDEALPDSAEALAVRDALQALTPRQRAAVVLKYFDDLPEREIASALGCRPGTVKSLLARALPQLREVLDD